MRCELLKQEAEDRGCW